MANDYCTLVEVQASLPDIPVWTTQYNTFINRLIPAASRLVDRKTNREPGAYYASANQVRVYDGIDWSGYSSTRMYGHDQTLAFEAFGAPVSYRSLRIDEIAGAPSLVEMSLDGMTYQSLVANDYFMWPYNAAQQGQPYTRIDLNLLGGNYQFLYSWPRAVRVTGPFGYSASVPDDVKQVVIIQVARWFKRGQQMYQDMAVVTDGVQAVYTKMDNDLAELVAERRRILF
jgi:hypothetical protein